MVSTNVETMNNLFLGKKLINNKGEEVLLEQILKSYLIGFYFTGSWCPPCELFTNELLAVYNEANAKEKMLEIIQISNEKSENDFKNFLGDKPWVFLDYFEFHTISHLVTEYKVNYLPKLVIVNKDKFCLTETGRKDVADNGSKAYEKWYKLYRVQKEREKELLINI
jgi:nucleoredoxin